MTSRTFQSKLIFFTAIGILTSTATPASAQMVSQSSCTMKPCECSDMPMLEEFLKAQTENLNAWKDVMGEFFSFTSAPATPQAARDSYASKVSAHPAILNACSSWAGSSSIKLGGLDKNGDAEFDQCFCNNFCDKIVDSVLKHEKRHVVNQVVLVTVSMPSLITSALVPGSLGKNNTESIRAQLLTISEVDAHNTQVDYLQKSFNDLSASLPASCTWTPLSKPNPRALDAAKSAASSQGFIGRVATLYSRVVHGSD